MRFIPAYAGNTPVLIDSSVTMPVHPRVRGEHGRGLQCHLAQVRFIPAYAGNTAPRRQPPPPAPVHPRVRGEHNVLMYELIPCHGSSPRTRGTHLPVFRGEIWPRFIPAYAGNTGTGWPAGASLTVHPRVRGEHPILWRVQVPYFGSSPRTRGTRHGPHQADHRPRFIPAYAGNTRDL